MSVRSMFAEMAAQAKAEADAHPCIPTEPEGRVVELRRREDGALVAIYTNGFEVEREAPSQPAPPVLDLGAGMGSPIRHLKRHGTGGTVPKHRQSDQGNR